MRKSHWVILLATLLIVVTGFVMFRSWLTGRPSWQLSVHNSARDALVEVYLTDQESPIYTTVLPEQNVPFEFHRLSREGLPIKYGKTVFYDETVRPGRWTVVIGGKTLDIMERALVLEDGTEISSESRGIDSK